jgi:hypothetical protein
MSAEGETALDNPLVQLEPTKVAFVTHEEHLTEENHKVFVALAEVGDDNGKSVWQEKLTYYVI